MTAASSPDAVGPLAVRDERVVVAVEGADRASFLEATLSQRIEALAPGQVAGALWLDVHGATLAALDVVADPDGERLLLVVPAAHRDPVLEQLAMRTFLADARFEATRDEVVAVRRHDEGVAPDEARRDGDVLLVGRHDGVDVVGAPAATARWLADRDLPPASDDLGPLLDHEIAHGVPRAPHEVAGPHLPEELGLLPTHVHLAKGCYPGQEAVARMWMLGRPRRRLVVVAVEDGRPGPGDEAGAGRERWTVTRVTSEAVAPPRALVLGPGHAAVGDEVDGDGWRGRVVQVVGEGVEQPGADPGVRRRRDRAPDGGGPTPSREVSPRARRGP